MPPGSYPTLIARLVREGPWTIEETCAAFDRTARDMGEDATLSVRQLRRWMEGAVGRPRAVSRRVAERLWGHGFDALVARPSVVPSQALVQNVIVQADNADMWEAAELLSRLDALDTSPATIEALAQTAERLCCDYRWRSAVDLRDEAIGWLREALRLRGRASLRAHRDLLTIAGWFGALIGCLEYDMGWRTAADATRGATASLARESENAEILAWTYEMSAWFALTQNRFVDALDAAEAGRRIGGERGVTVQLHAQEARAFARLGDLRGVSVSLDQGRALLDRLNRPEHPENHFVVDPDKWDFYAMDAFRLVGDDHRADFHARAVIELGKAPDGTERSPMRMAEARITLGVVAARAGELEEAVEIGIAGFQAGRRSLPSLLLVAEELNSALLERNPPDRLRQEYRAALRAITSD